MKKLIIAIICVVCGLLFSNIALAEQEQIVEKIEITPSESNDTFTHAMLQLKYNQACETWRMLLELRYKIIAIYFTLMSGLLLTFKWAYNRNMGFWISLGAIVMVISLAGMEWRCRMMYRKAGLYARSIEAIDLSKTPYYTAQSNCEGICSQLSGKWWGSIWDWKALKQNLKSSFNLVYLFSITCWVYLFMKSLKYNSNATSSKRRPDKE